MIADKLLYNEEYKAYLKNITDNFIREVGQKQTENLYLLADIADENGLVETLRDFKIDLKNNITVIDVSLHKKLYYDFVNVIVTVTYGNVKKSDNFPFELNSCVFSLYFDIREDDFMNHEPYDIELGYDSVCSNW